jgi:DNA mismatch endonuclease (patch repair protein)
MPKSRLVFWEPKLKGNRRRDERVKAVLEQNDWRVIEVWECQTKPDDLRMLVDRVRVAVSARGALREHDKVARRKVRKSPRKSI